MGAHAFHDQILLPEKNGVLDLTGRVLSFEPIFQKPAPRQKRQWTGKPWPRSIAGSKSSLASSYPAIAGLSAVGFTISAPGLLSCRTLRRESYTLGHSWRVALNQNYESIDPWQSEESHP